MNNKILSIDAETNGLWGLAFAVAATVTVDGEETSHFLARCPITGDTDPWVAKNVLPKLEGVKETHRGYMSMVLDFAIYYTENKDGADVVAHIPCPVETGLFHEMRSLDLIGDWDAPFPLYCPSALLLALGENPSSVDEYLSHRGLTVPHEEGGTHNPLYDCRAADLAWRTAMEELRGRQGTPRRFAGE